MKKRSIYGSLILVHLFVLSGLILTTCEEEPVEKVFFEEDELLISAYLEEHRDDYSSLIHVLELADLKSTLNAYGHYTFFAPDNSAFDSFLEQQGKSSPEEFDEEYLVNLVRYHLLDIVIESAYFRDGVIQDTTYSGDHLVVTFSEGGLENIMVNDATITERDIQVENGIIHRINRVLEPVTGSIVDRLQEDGEFSVFSDALEITSLADSLDMVNIRLNEDIYYRSRFTLFVESDETYFQNGIHTVQDLIDKFSDTGDPTEENDGLHRYVAYHVIPDLLFLNELDSFNYQTLAEDFHIHVTLEDEVYLNRHTDEQAGLQYIKVIEEESNQSAKNGTYHVIDRIMEPYEPEPVYMIIDLTNYQGISIGQEYTEKELEDIRGISAENTGLWFRNSILADGETNLQTTNDRVGWEVEFELPPITRGKYDVYFHWASHSINTWWAQAFWDDARLGDTFSFQHQKRWPGVEWKRDFNTSQYMGRVTLTATERHTIKFVSLLEGHGNFDYLALWPVEE
ncbi:MAG: fasciclin domain-containing protein [Bacteroidales bacterium]